MAHTTAQSLWALARRQHGVVSRRQLLDIGFTTEAIRHRINRGRLHPVYRGVYAVGRPELTREGWWMAAVLSCGDGAVLSHLTAAVLWGIRPRHGRRIDVSVPGNRAPRRPGIAVHRRVAVDSARHKGIPVTSVASTLIDIAPRLRRNQLEAAVNEADVLDLIDPEALRDAIDARPGQPGVAALRDLLHRATFTLTRSELERLFLPIARRAGLPKPETQAEVNGFEVDFYWPNLGLVVETDSLRYHRTPAKQTRDVLRDQAHAVADVERLRFTHAQVAYQPRYVEATLRALARRLAG
jgi:very-short-patch-repair endonuclease